MAAMMSVKPVAVLARPAAASRTVRARSTRQASASSFVKGANALAPLRASARAQPAAAQVLRGLARRTMVVRAEQMDFDQILAKGADAWEKSDKKLPIVGYSLATFVGIYFIESIVHLPLLNILLGVPLELLGIFSGVALGYRYLKEGQDPITDISDLTSKVTKDLPGFK